MKRLLAIELQKIWKNRASRVLTISYFVILSSIALISSINFSFIGLNIRMADMGIYNFPFIWHFNTFVAGLFKFFFAIVIVSMIANEYSYGTLKQNLIDGLSKKEFILSKFYTILFFSLLSTIYVFIMTLILGYSFSSFDESAIVFSDLEYLIGYFVKLMGFFSLCLFIGTLIKRSAFAIGFIFIWYIFEKILMHVINIPNSLDKFLPLESMYNLIPEPITRFKAYRAIENQVSGKDLLRDYDVHFSAILIVLFWSILFLFLSYKIIQKRDL
ncbi:ABC transporter permease [Flavobacterium sp. N1994]|uniref:ABC transporter permease n=1 Tax=Flavobacterium sp. N1994 TaxID=2986827 RepID=UPI00222173AE|nr:ABC transporter permease [Flavobacterium sp. N1994]